MAQGRDEDELLVEQPHALEPVEGFGVDECHHEVQAAVAELAEQREGDVLSHRDRHSRVGTAEVGDQLGGLHGTNRRDAAEAERAPHQAAEGVQVRAHTVHLGERAPCSR
jgi:hypothetical protein